MLNTMALLKFILSFGKIGSKKHRTTNYQQDHLCLLKEIPDTVKFLGNTRLLSKETKIYALKPA